MSWALVLGKLQKKHFADIWPETFLFFADLDNGFGPPFPRFELFVDKTWSPPDLDRLLAYLATAPRVVGSPPVASLGKGGRPCRLCGRELHDESSIWYDGVWNWADDLSHYVRHHHMRLPQRLVDRIRSKDYRAPLATDVKFKPGIAAKYR